jgi:DNA-binding transcriptional LysR family regulator
MDAKTQPLNWDDLRFFLAVARSGSYKSAARSLAVNPTTVGRRLTVLEAVVKKKLFVRTPEALVPTPAGLGLRKRAESVELEMLACERELTGLDSEINGPLRVTAADGFMNYVLLPAIEELRRLHPGLALDLRSDTRVLDLSRREADVAIRLVRPREPALIARRIGDMRMGLFASAHYLERRGTPRSASALAAHDLIGFDASLDTAMQVKWLHRTVPSARYILRANTTTSQVLAACLGHGIVLLPVFVARREPTLRRILARLQCPTRELWSVTHSDLKNSPKVKVFTEFVSQLVRVVGDPAHSD